MEKPEQPGGTPSARQTAPQQREPQIGAQTAARQEEMRQTPPAPQPWEYGQPRVKSKNAALLQWGCALVILLCAASALLFAFLPIFPYSADGADGAFSAFELVQNGAEAYSANGSLVAVCALYLCIALLAPIFLAALLTHAGSYTRNMRKLAWVFSMLQTMWSVVSAGLYILAASLSSGGESSALPYSLALPKGTKRACALRSSSSQKSRFAAIFGNPVAAYLRLLRKGVNVRDFYYFSRKENHTFPQRNSIWQNFACCRKGECAAFL